MSFKAFSRDSGNNILLPTKSKRSQSALEYMMTYGWAILIIVIVAVILYSMGIFNPSSSITTTITGFQSLGVTQANCINSVNNQILELYITNNVGYPVNITSINVTGNNGLKVTQDVGSLLNPGASSSFYVNGACNKSSSSYSGSATITYTEPGQQLPGPYVSTGSLVKVPANSNPNKVASFNGVTSHVLASDGNLPKGSSPRTILAWVNSTKGGAVASYGTAANGEWFTLAFGSGSSFVIATWGSYFSFNTLPSPSSGRWTFLAITLLSSTSAIGYENTQSDLNTTPTYATNTVGTGTFVIGDQNPPGYVQFNGSIADVQVYNTILSTAQIQKLYSEGIGGAPIPNAGLVDWYPLDGNANDYSSSNNNGVPTAVQWISP